MKNTIKMTIFFFKKVRNVNSYIVRIVFSKHCENSNIVRKCQMVVEKLREKIWKRKNNENYLNVDIIINTQERQFV